MHQPAFCRGRVETAQLQKRQVVEGAGPVGVEQKRGCIGAASLRQMAQALMQTADRVPGLGIIQHDQSESHGEGITAVLQASYPTPPVTQPEEPRVSISAPNGRGTLCVMRILLVNHGSAGAWGGGDGVQIRETGKRLQQRGHDVVGVNADQP